jgi:hypothetical protein
MENVWKRRNGSDEKTNGFELGIPGKPFRHIVTTICDKPFVTNHL